MTPLPLTVSSVPDKLHILQCLSFSCSCSPFKFSILMLYLFRGQYRMKKKGKLKPPSCLPPPVHFDPTALPPAHVEGHDSDLYPLRGLAMHLAQLQPVVVLLPPQIQHFSRHKHGTWKNKNSRHEIPINQVIVRAQPSRLKQRKYISQCEVFFRGLDPTRSE